MVGVLQEVELGGVGAVAVKSLEECSGARTACDDELANEPMDA
ncbi:hypothetical protein [Streptomyces sp. NPDC057579]